MITLLVRRVLPVAAVAGTAGLLIRHQRVPEAGADMWFHLRFGSEFMDGWRVGGPGSLGVFDSAQWYPSQWLSQVAMAAAERSAGLTGVLWLAGTLIACVPIVLYLAGRIHGAAPLPAALAMVLGTLAAAPGLSARPQVISYVLITVVTITWLAIARDGRPRWWLVVLQWVWVPLHGMWIIGITVAIAVLVGIVLERRHPRATIARLALLPALSAVVALITPIGVHVVTSVVALSSRTDQLAEWQPTDFTSLPGAVLVGMLATVLMIALRREQLDWAPVMVLGLAICWAIYSERTAVVAAFMTVPLLAVAVQTLVPRVPPPDRRELAGVAMIAVLASGAMAVVAGARADDRPLDRSVDARLAAMPTRARVLNDWQLGPYLLWAHPQLDLVMHGYVDVFTSGELERNVRLTRLEPGWDAELDRLDLDYAIVDPDSPLGYAMSRRQGWTRIAGDDDVVILSAGQG